MEKAILSLFGDKIRGMWEWTCCDKLIKVIEKSLKIYLTENLEEEIAKKLFNKSFGLHKKEICEQYNLLYNAFPGTGEYDLYDLISDFAKRRATNIVKFLTGEIDENIPIEETLNLLTTYYDAEKAKFKILEDNGCLTITDFTIGDLAD